MAQRGALIRPMASDAPPSWPGALWVGLLDDVPGSAPLPLADADGYRHARLLVREAGTVRGFVEAAVVDGALDGALLSAAVDTLPPTPARPPAPALQPVTVIVCTRDRPDQLSTALASVLAVDHPHFEVVVVDNASRTGETRAVVDSLAMDSPVPLRCVHEPRPGLATARNTGVRHSGGDVVAFTDDDVVVDPQWLRRLADGTARHPDVTCVTGLVPSGELRAPVQAYFEQRVSWTSSCAPRVYRMADPPADMPLFPFRFGAFGTGANFAMQRDALLGLGGFDEAFGVGSPTMGGEDIDMFLRVVVAGQALAFEPSAVVWHRHRSDLAALQVQAVGYGAGVGALLTKIALDRTTGPLAVRRAVAGLRRARELAAPAPAASDTELDADLRAALRTVGGAERRAVLTGPTRYRRARREGRTGRPLASGTTR